MPRRKDVSEPFAGIGAFPEICARSLRHFWSAPSPRILPTPSCQAVACRRRPKTEGGLSGETRAWIPRPSLGTLILVQWSSHSVHSWELASSLSASYCWVCLKYTDWARRYSCMATGPSEALPEGCLTKLIWLSNTRCCGLHRLLTSAELTLAWGPWEGSSPLAGRWRCSGWDPKRGGKPA